MRELVSVIVATYNQERTIGRTIDSILMQECDASLEIIIGEDASTDGTRAICEYYASKHPDVIRLMPKSGNKGLVKNYFDCLLATRGQYIADCAGDDFWTDIYKLQKQLDLIRQDIRITLVHTNWNQYDEATGHTTSNRYTPFPTTITDGKEMLTAILTQTGSPVIHLCTALYRADKIKALYQKYTPFFRDKDLGCEDLQVCALLAANGFIGYLPDITINYSVGHDSVSSHRDDRRQFQFVRQTTEQSFCLMRLLGQGGNEYRIFFEKKVFALAMHSFRVKDQVLRDKAEWCRRHWGVPHVFKYIVIRAVTSCSVTWQLALLARTLVVSVKRKWHR